MSALSVHINVDRTDFSFEVHEEFSKGITGIFGHSGAGKTTLLQCISGVEIPARGTISVNETTLFSSEQKINVKVHKRNVGYVFQEGRLFPHFTVEKNLKYGLRFHKQRNTISFDTVVQMLEIGHLLQSYPSEISGGERQRVALGRVLLSAPQVLLLDEPFSALDQKLRQQIIPFIHKISKVLDIPVLIVSHDLPDILKLTNKLCILSKGSIVGHGLYEDLIKQDSMLQYLPSGDIINSVTLEIKQIDVEANLITLNGCGANRKINIVFEPKLSSYKMGDMVRVFLRPNDIVLGLQELSSTSFQNQLQGTITRIIEDGPRVLCQVDCGFTLLAEVSKASVKKMMLTKGKQVYCLFKSLAIDTIQL